MFDHNGTGPRTTELMLFKQIWYFSNKRSFVSGLILRDFMKTDFFLNCFAHVLSKSQSKYPHFKYYAKNIALLTPGEHALWDQGTEEQRIKYAEELKEKNVIVDWGKMETLRDELKAEYKKAFPSTRGFFLSYKYNPQEVIEILGVMNRSYWDEINRKLNPK